MSAERVSGPDLWPELPLDAWKSTYDTLHLWTQVVSKVKKRLSPFQQEWWHLAFQLWPRGIRTGSIPYGAGLFEVSFDFVDHQLRIFTNNRDQRAMSLRPRSVADFYGEFMGLMRAQRIAVEIETDPEEMDVTTPFDRDEEHASYDREAVERWWLVMTRASKVFEDFRTPFAGRSSPLQFFTGSFDLSYGRYSGRAGSRAGQLEQIAAGFWPGSGRVTGAAFYAYAAPEPDGFRTALVGPDAARFDEALGEFILLYDDVRRSATPESAILQFLQTTYEAGANLGRWDRALLEQPVPQRAE